MDNKTFTHVLQKKGVLRTFSVAKVVKKKDIDELKSLIKSIAANDAEYNQMLKEEMAKLSDMHSDKNPIPGIIYNNDELSARRNLIYAIANKFSKNIKSMNFEKGELAFLISSIVAKLELEQEDFTKLSEELENELGDEDDEDGEDQEEDGDEYKY